MIPWDILQTYGVWMAFIFFASGAIKGITGFGMPFIALPGLIFAGIPVTQSMAWVLVSSFGTNILQLLQTLRYGTVLRRTWPIVVGQILVMLVAVQFLDVVDSRILMMFVGLSMSVSIVSQWKGQWHLPEGRETLSLWIGGGVSGLIGGLTSFFGFPAMQVLMATGLQRKEFIFMASLTLFTGGIVLGLGLGTQGLMDLGDLLVSLILLVPAVMGLFTGQWVQRHLSPRGFKLAISLIIFGTGLSLLVRGWLGI